METKTTTIHARIEPKIKKDATLILSKLGLTASEAISLFLRQVSLTKGLPFELRIPNKESLKAIKDVRLKKDLKVYKTAETWINDIRSL